VRVRPLRLLLYAVLVLGALAAVVPFLYMLMTSLKTYGSVIAGSVWPWPPFGSEPLQWQNYPAALARVGWDDQWQTWLFVRYLANSVIVTGAAMIGTLLTSILAAYALARIELPGKALLFGLLLATVMVPEDVSIVPKVVMMFNLRWYNTYLALIVPFTVSVFGIFLLRQFFIQIPRELFEAALVDGMGHLRFLTAVVVPLSRPAILTLALLTFVGTWDSFRWPLLVTRDASMRVLAVGLQQFMLGEGGDVHLLMAFATLVTAPIILFYFLVQRQFRDAVLTAGIRG
jgi:ABC-type glycerol-3-phosphate transport system permease component